jgi:hypothetical protein
VDALHHVTVLQQSAKQSDAPQKEHREHLLTMLQCTVFPITPPHLSTHKATALATLSNQWDKTDRAHGPMSCISRPGSDTLHPPPFLVGVNTWQKYHHRHQQLYTAGTRCFTNHDFTAGYSIHHRAFTNNNISCLCGCIFTRDHILTMCPIHSTPRRCLFGNYAHMDYILGTEAGGRAFALFTDETGIFLKPLPPRPDPP